MGILFFFRCDSSRKRVDAYATLRKARVRDRPKPYPARILRVRGGSQPTREVQSNRRLGSRRDTPKTGPRVVLKAESRPNLQCAGAAQGQCNISNSSVCSQSFGLPSQTSQGSRSMRNPKKKYAFAAGHRRREVRRAVLRRVPRGARNHSHAPPPRLRNGQCGGKRSSL